MSMDTQLSLMTMVILWALFGFFAYKINDEVFDQKDPLLNALVFVSGPLGFIAAVFASLIIVVITIKENQNG